MKKLIRYHERACQLLRAIDKLMDKEKLMLSRSKVVANGNFSVLKEDYLHDADIARRAIERLTITYNYLQLLTTT